MKLQMSLEEEFYEKEAQKSKYFKSFLEKWDTKLVLKEGEKINELKFRNSFKGFLEKAEFGKFYKCTSEFGLGKRRIDLVFEPKIKQQKFRDYLEFKLGLSTTQIRKENAGLTDQIKDYKGGDKVKHIYIVILDHPKGKKGIIKNPDSFKEFMTEYQKYMNKFYQVFLDTKHIHFYIKNVSCGNRPTKGARSVIEIKKPKDIEDVINEDCE